LANKVKEKDVLNRHKKVFAGKTGVTYLFFTGMTESAQREREQLY